MHLNIQNKIKIILMYLISSFNVTYQRLKEYNNQEIL